MGVRLKQLQDQVIVITGASSGIGRATAEMAARTGARVVLSARNASELEEVVASIRREGGHATFVAADVTDPQAMENLARQAVAEFGGFDTWVNNAGVGIYGRLDEVPLEQKRKLFDVNFWGVVHGCRAAVRHLRGRGGALINIGSVVSDRALPLLGIYAASKHAVKGYTDALRMELEAEGAPISVTLVKPASIDTPFTEHAANHMQTEPEYAPPVYAPEEVARAILRCAVKPTRDIIVGGGGRMISMLGHVAPRLTDTIMERTMFRAQQKDESRRTGDALHAPGEQSRTHGSTDRLVMSRSAYTRAALSDAARALPLVPLVAIGAFVAARLTSRGD